MGKKKEHARWPGTLVLKFIEGWFVLLGFVTIIAVIEAAAIVSEVDVLNRVVEFSYTAMTFWVLIKVNHFVWKRVPSFAPIREGEPVLQLRTLFHIAMNLVLLFPSFVVGIFLQGIVRRIVEAGMA